MNRCLHELFEAQVEETPSALAVVFEDRCLSYRGLNNRANRLACYLQRLGVGPEVCVGICMEPCLELASAVIAILKAGGAYVPLDPFCPEDRLASVLAATRIQVVLTQKKLMKRVPTWEQKVLCLDEIRSSLVAEKTTNTISGAVPANLAYVIFTSGSSGSPKGVAITHANAVRLFQWGRSALDLCDDDVWTLFHSIAFDFSVWEIWGALLHGARLVIVPYWVSRSPESFGRLLRTEAVTILNQIPSAFWQLARSEEERGDQSGSLPALRLVIFGGEILETQRLGAFLRRFGSDRLRLVNMYGTTETTVHVTFRPDIQVNDGTARGSPIGRPLVDMEVYLLDPLLAPVPPGSPGQMCVCGAGLGRGYLNQPALTAERFTPDPFEARPGARLYLTGDTARCQSTGDLEFLGRFDHQVKIRGFRVELDEISAVLAVHPGVRECVVSVDHDAFGHKRIVAYVVADHGWSASTTELRRSLGSKLPSYMVPAVFVWIDSLPRSPSGKVDRRALPAPTRVKPELAEPFANARSLTESSMAKSWAEVLGLEEVGIHDDFFELGGHSLLATRVISRLRKTMRVELSVRDLFEAPTIAKLVQRIHSARRSAHDRSITPLQPTPRRRHMPLSFAQQRLWLTEQIEPESPTYNLTTSLRLVGRLDVAAIERCFCEVVRRHEILRTIFTVEALGPAQRILPAHPVMLPVLEMPGSSRTARDAAALRCAREEACRPFDLRKGPLLRTALLRIDQEEHLLLLNVHHIVADGWSHGVIFDELSTLYAAFSRGDPSPLPEVALHYADFAHWQRQWLHGEVLDSLLSYWRRQLDGAPPRQLLPIAETRPAVGRNRGGRRRFRLSHDLSLALLWLNRSEDVTMFMTLLAAFETLLHRYSCQDDIVVGTIIANRNRAEFEKLIGFFANTLVIRTDFSANPSFRALLRQVRDTTLEAYAYQDLPFEKLVEELRPERSGTQTPFFQTAFVFQNYPTATVRLAGLTASHVDPGQATTVFDLTLSMTKTEERLAGTLEYDRDLFSDDAVQRMAGHFECLLKSIVRDPDRPVSQLPILPLAERSTLLSASIAPTTNHPGTKCIHQLFEDRVDRIPHSVALVFEDLQLTYHELNRKANRLAHYLQSLKVGPEVKVGICMERGVDFIVSLLAVFKAGGAYVPLDPEYPTERLVYQIKDSEISLLLTHSWTAQRQPHLETRPVCLDVDGERIARQKALNPAGEGTPNNLAYIIYTSGSTGKPKGVEVEHRMACNLARAQIELFSIGRRSRILQSASPAFDASVAEILQALLSGGVLCLARNESLLPGRNLIRLLHDAAITTVTFPPSTLAALPVAELPALGTIITAGEACPADLVARWSAGRRFWNAYGPTEATVCATAARCSKKDSKPPIGRPIANAEVYVLDDEHQPVPVGIPGELYIGGQGVARGYHNRPDLTAERFVPHPYIASDGVRLYKTGDICRWLPKGDLDFLGRRDQQVKIRGFRVEPREIEAVLLQHDAVRNVAVIARQDRGGSLRLVAYVAPDHDLQEDAAGQLAPFLRKRLPPHLVPSVFVALPTLPLTTNGKVDRKALSHVHTPRRREQKDVSAACGAIEELLAVIWSELLEVTEIRRHDNFFDLGGHSLLALMSLSRIYELLDVELPSNTLFENPTIAQLSAALSKHEGFLDRQQKIVHILQEIRGLSQEQVEAILAEEEAGHRGDDPPEPRRNVLN